MPFFPAGWPLGLAALAAGVTLARERAGLALALAVPVLPLGNSSAGLAWAYAAVALGWLALSWRDARNGLLFLCGPLLAPLSLLGLLPLAVQRVPSAARRAAQTFVAVLASAAAAGLAGLRLPFTTAAAPPLHLNRTSSPFVAASHVWHALATHPALLFEAVVLAVAGVVLPRLGQRRIGAFSLALLLGIVAPDPALPDAAIVATILVTCLGLALRSER
jgi:hypothetical protein